MSNLTFLDALTKLSVWNKGLPITGYLPSIYRRDKFGTAMQFSEYGNRNSVYGWEIDHIIPTSKGGSDDYQNLEPLNWKNNSAKSDKLI